MIYYSTKRLAPQGFASFSPFCPRAFPITGQSAGNPVSQPRKKRKQPPLAKKFLDKRRLFAAI
jgi:hypothetical protein